MEHMPLQTLYYTKFIRRNRTDSPLAALSAAPLSEISALALARTSACLPARPILGAHADYRGV